ncbi:MAG: hypothetical protein RIQ89_1059 [Bacteroidota bacterium]|jgi:leukotriene A-4 hydrolase/aminopeptidase
MYRQILVFLAAVWLIANSCQTNNRQPAQNQTSTAMNVDTSPVFDPHSYATPNESVVEHLDLSLTVNFKAKQLTGAALWTIKPNHGKEIIFDVKNLLIDSVLVDNDEGVNFHLSPDDKIKGKALTVSLKKNTAIVKIFYRTPPNAEALQWLNPTQTADKIAPFLFTQSQAILARTWIPCQDSPSIRFTYEAKVKVPDGMMAIMSAQNGTQKNDSNIYHFKQDIAIPSYLMALAVGDFVYKPYDQRCGIYAEHGSIEKAWNEFTDLPAMIKAAEQLYGPYRWGRFDMIVLPPSFPFGGMENPCITFATPTIIAGDKSLTNLVAHELAHSWSGNLVTNATWNDFWLNEGFTVYFERRIIEAVYGKDFAAMQQFLGQQDLHDALNDLKDTPDDTKLKLKLDGRNPDDGMNDIAYEKGNCLLLVIENAVGREKWDDFLKNYFSQLAFTTITTERFVSLLQSHLLTDSLYQALQIDAWIYQTGIPNNMPAANSTLLESATDAAKAFLNTHKTNPALNKSFNAMQWQQFIRSLSNNLTANEMKELDTAHHFTASGNNEILFLWLQLSIETNYKEALPTLERFLEKVGRRKFIKPLYQAMMKNSNTKDLAIKSFSKYRNNYHSVTANTVANIINR